MKEHPILFSGPMVRALLADRKSVTRRMSRQWLKVRAGDRLWVRETWGSKDADHPRAVAGRKPQQGDRLVYQANDADAYQWGAGKPSQGGFVWRPSIHMPRWASRILLEAIEDARLERLQDITDITEEDAIAEGVDHWSDSANHPRWKFQCLWESLHAKPGERWEDNPDVVRVGKFRRVA